MNELKRDKTVFFVSLGCSKNLVDSEVMLGLLVADGFEIVESANDADTIIVNTCSFVEDARQESIDMILELLDYKQNGNGKSGRCSCLVVAGCLSQRYSEGIKDEIPEVDLIIGTGEYHKIVELIKNKSPENIIFVQESRFIHSESDPRMITTPFYTSWLKVSEGCDRRCSFCIIPDIRGKLRSRTAESLFLEAEVMSEKGVRELNIISQDLSVYGNDLGGENTIENLLNGLQSIKGLDWIRLLYYYPDDLTDDLMTLFSKLSKICKYIDMPVQHFSDSVLKRMNRKITGAEILKKILMLRKQIPNIVIRTSIIVGFPGETESDFQSLLDGIKEVQFDHLGVFRYSDEEGTPAFKMKNKIEQDVIDQRFRIVYEIQREIVRKRNNCYIGQVLDVLVEGEHRETELLLMGRHSGQAPDIDGCVIINDISGFNINIGDIVKLKITEVVDYDLVGHVVSADD